MMQTDTSMLAKSKAAYNPEAPIITFTSYISIHKHIQTGNLPAPTIRTSDRSALDMNNLHVDS